MVHISNSSPTAMGRRVKPGHRVARIALCMTLGATVAGISLGLNSAHTAIPAYRSVALALPSWTRLMQPSARLLGKGMGWATGCFARHAVETLPVMICVPNQSIQAGGTANITVQVNQVPAAGGAVQVSCTRPDILVSPS